MSDFTIRTANTNLTGKAFRVGTLPPRSGNDGYVLNEIGSVPAFRLAKDTDFFGGLRVVTDATARDAIVANKKTAEMWVNVQSDGRTYRWTGSAWVEKVFGMASIPDPLELAEFRVKPAATVVMAWLEDDTFASGKPLFTTDSGGTFFDADGSRDGIIQLKSREVQFHGSAGAEKGLILDGDSAFTVQAGPGAELVLKSREADSASAVAVRLISETALVTSGAKLVTFENSTTEKLYIDKDGLLHFPFTGNPSEQGMWFPSPGGVDDQQFLGRSANVTLSRSTAGFSIQTVSGTDGTLFVGVIHNNIFRPRASSGIMVFRRGTAGFPGTEDIIANFTSGSGAVPTIDRHSFRVKSNGAEVPFSNLSDVSNQIFNSYLLRFGASYWNGSSATDRKFEVIHEMLSTVPSSRLNFDLDGTTVAEVWDDGSVRLNTNGGTKPTASATHRGKLFVEQGAGGVTDRYFVCLKSAADAFSWVEVANGG